MKINGLKVVDATKPLPIKVTDRDVEKGQTKDPSCCAAALACLRKATEARVHIGRTYLRHGNVWVRYKTPLSVRSEIIAFDRGAPFAPGDYELAPMPKSGRLGQYTHRSKTVKKPAHLKVKRKPYHTVTGVRAHGANR